MKRVARTLEVVLHSCGPLFIALACAMTVPLVLVLIYGEFHQGPETLEAFLLPAALSLFLGIFLHRVLRARPLNRLQSALICSVGWLGFSAIGALPFMIGIHSTYLDGFFEAMSGFTTTGITMFTGLDQMPKSIGMTVREITEQRGFPKECVFVGIYHEDSDIFCIPRGDHDLKEWDTIFLVSNSQYIKPATDFLTKS